MPEVHSKTIQPSAFFRHGVCTNSMRLESQFPDERSEVAAVGTDGHALAEYQLKQHLGIACEKPESDLVDDEVAAAVDEYVTYGKDQIIAAKTESADAAVYVEKRVSVEEYVAGCFGTADLVTITPNKLHVMDLKLGFNPVSAVGNYQLQIYALGLLSVADLLYETVQDVELTIIQPRINNFSTWEVSADEIRRWGREVFVPKAEEALSGNGVFAPGPDTCRYCKARHKCRARAEYFEDLATHDFVDPELLSDDEIAEILLKVEALKKWAEEVFSYAETEAITNHKAWQGFKVVRATSRRKYSDEAAVIKAAREAGFSDVTKESPIGITEMERLMGKKTFDSVLGKLVIKPEGRLRLVPEAEKGEPVNLDTATEDFS